MKAAILTITLSDDTPVKFSMGADKVVTVTLGFSYKDLTMSLGDLLEASATGEGFARAMSAAIEDGPTCPVEEEIGG